MLQNKKKKVERVKLQETFGLINGLIMYIVRILYMCIHIPYMCKEITNICRVYHWIHVL